MAGVADNKLADLIATTLKDLPKNEFEVMWDSQHFEFGRLYQQSRRQITGGTSIQRNVMLDRSGRAKYRRLYDTDQPVVDNNQHQINVPWTQFGTDYSWDKLELLRNRDSAKGFINLIQSRRLERLWDMAEMFEERHWMTPNNAADTKHPFGVPYYINLLNAGSSTGGFHGQTVRYQDGTSGTIVAGIDGAVEPKWRNYADVYQKVDNALLRTLRSAVRRTRFRPSPWVTSPGKDGAGLPIKIYAADHVVGELEDLSDKRDDNNSPNDLAGKMLHSYDGVAHFNRMPVVYIPHLDDFTVADGNGDPFNPDPIFCIDFTKFIPYVQDGYWMEESEPMRDRGQHTTFTVFTDSAHQNLCINRRTVGWVIHKLIPAAS
jgi:hypothetical protein